MVMRDIDHIDEYIQILADLQAQCEENSRQWCEIQSAIEACENMYYWLVDEKWKENKKPNLKGEITMDCKQEQIRDHIERIDEFITTIESLINELNVNLYGDSTNKLCGNENVKADGLIGALRDLDIRLECAVGYLKEIVNRL